MRFKVGERVKVKKDLQLGKTYYMINQIDADTFEERMLPFLGKEATIMAVEYGRYKLDIDPFHYYTDEMLNKFSDQKAERDYQGNLEVEELVNHMLGKVSENRENVIKQEIDKALDEGNVEKFNELVKKLKRLEVN